jgi:thioredoxin-like negative regulator of GroEL
LKNNVLIQGIFVCCCPGLSCRFIAPVFEKLANENPDCEFVKVDVDDADDVAAHCQIQAMPTFHFYKGGAKVAEFSGADQAKLISLVQANK